MAYIYRTIVNTSVLARHLDDPNWAIVDCRFDLSDPDSGQAAYQEAHIPGAIYAHLDRDLSGPVTPQSGRHPLPDVQEMANRLSGWGIGDSTQVVVYDSSGGSFAVRLWWLLRFLGHWAVAVLDGGFPKWQRENRPTSAGVEQRAPASFTADPNWNLVYSTEDVERIRLDPHYRLVDARSAMRFHGENEPIDPVAGHIPGAINRFHAKNLTREGTFQAPEALRQQFNELLGSTAPDHVVVYCGSGVTSIHHILAMELAGLPGARLYAGSWSEWIRDRKRPIS